MDTLGKSQLEAEVAERTGLARESVKNVMDTMFEVIGEELSQGNKVNITGYLKASLTVTKAIKKGTMVRNPFDGTESKHPGKPAGVRVKLSAGNKLKSSAPSPTSKAAKAVIASKK